MRNSEKTPVMKAGSRILIAVLAAAAFLGLLYFANYDRPVYKSDADRGITYEVARVNEILADTTVEDEQYDGALRGSMQLLVEILSGDHKGEIVQITNYFSVLYNVQVEEGDKVSVRIDNMEDGTFSTSIYNYYRVPKIIGAVLVFLLFLVVIGGKKGAKSAAGLIFTLICIVWLLLPLSMKGYSPLLVTIFIIMICNLVTFYLVDGVQLKTIVAATGSVCGVLAGALFAIIAQNMMSITTYHMDEAESLMLIMSSTKFQMKNLLLCGILIACMGAVMDVAMSIASSVAELHAVNPKLGRKELFRSGMNIGRDAMGTMSNTLILAFAGNSLNMMIMICSYGVTFQQLLNTDFVAIEVIRSIAGSIGIICTVPIVAAISATVFAKKK